MKIIIINENNVQHPQTPFPAEAERFWSSKWSEPANYNQVAWIKEENKRVGNIRTMC